MQPYERARIKIISDLNLVLTLQEVRDLGLTLKWLFNKDAAMAIFEQEKGQNNMTEKELLEIKIKHLHDRKKLMTSEIDLKLRLLEEALALQKGFERSGRHGFFLGQV